MRRVFLLSVTLTAILASPAVLGAQPDGPALPKPLGYVSDYAGVLDPEWKARIRSVCKDLERKTGVEMVVVTTSSIEPFDTTRQYADALYKYWRIGSAQQQRGVMVVAYTGAPQASVTVGRNMISVIPPPLLHGITARYLEPTFRLGQYAEGLYRAAVALATASQDVRAGAPPRTHRGRQGFWLMIFSVATFFGFFWWISRPDKRHPYRRIQHGEFWGPGRGGFGGNLGGFGGGTSGEGYS